ncbi:hypothetical protein [Pseudomonas sp. SJZ131]|uniref:hypothetical protein n=1 Tax=Pseudomonas sp. SJZ131 TaxID=2572895 RepID=UPI0011A343AC|nr:hypothetical protein [Pseudomonas sp. SJZ131]
MKFELSSLGVEQGPSVDGDTITQVQKIYLALLFQSHTWSWSNIPMRHLQKYRHFRMGTKLVREFFWFSPDATPYTISGYFVLGRPPRLLVLTAN